MLVLGELVKVSVSVAAGVAVTETLALDESVGVTL